MPGLVARFLELYREAQDAVQTRPLKVIYDEIVLEDTGRLDFAATSEKLSKKTADMPKGTIDLAKQLLDLVCAVLQVRTAHVTVGPDGQPKTRHGELELVAVYVCSDLRMLYTLLVAWHRAEGRAQPRTLVYIMNAFDTIVSGSLSVVDEEADAFQALAHPGWQAIAEQKPIAEKDIRLFYEQRPKIEAEVLAKFEAARAAKAQAAGGGAAKADEKSE